MIPPMAGPAISQTSRIVGFPALAQMTQTVSPNPRAEAAAALRLPLEILPPGSNWLSPRAEAWWLWTFLAAGLALRLARYLLRFPLWEDEAMLAANFVDRGYRELLQPLHYCQVAPPLFLWGQLTVVKLLGFTEWALRLVPFLCGMASLVLFRHVAGRLLSGVALVLAVGIFAVSFPMTRYAAEAKPYGCDLLLALAMLALAVEWLRRPGQSRWLWVLAAVVGPAVGYSFPAMFLAGGISLVTGYVLWRSERGRESFPGNRRDDSPPLRSCLCAWLVYNLVLAASVVCLVIVSSRAVGELNRQTMETIHWADSFPPLTHPLRLIGWFFSIHAGGMLGYPVGGPHWGSTFSFLCAAVGVVVLARRRQGLLLALLLAPLALNFAAAALHRFPYGGHARMTLFLAPTFCTLISLGLSSGLAWFAAGGWKAEGGRPPTTVLRMVAAGTPVFLLLAALAAGTLLRDLVKPYKSGTTLRAREFARWFWSDLPEQGERASLETDFHVDLAPGKPQTGWSCLYCCNQRIYSPRHARGEPPRWDRISAACPLRCAVYRSAEEERRSPAADPRAVEHWLEGMQARFELVAHDCYPFLIYEKWDRTVTTVDYIEVFKFAPRPGRPCALTARRDDKLRLP
jgi:hypothetical protein